MVGPRVIELFSDLHCPYAYVAAFRLRQIEHEYAGRVVVRRRCLPLEFKNRRPTPKNVLDVEAPILLAAQPEIPYAPWHGHDSDWPATMWPAFEACKCAERQGDDSAVRFDWALREAFFSGSWCISMRHVLLELAQATQLDLVQFTTDFDSGASKALVMKDAERGWTELGVKASPTFVLPSGRQILNPALIHVDLDPEHHYRPAGIAPPDPPDEPWQVVYRRMFEEADAGPTSES